MYYRKVWRDREQSPEKFWAHLNRAPQLTTDQVPLPLGFDVCIAV